MQSFAEKDWRYVIDFDYLAKLSKNMILAAPGRPSMKAVKSSYPQRNPLFTNLDTFSME